MAKHRVLLVDDHPIVLKGLRLTLQAHDDVQIVGETHDSRTILTLVETARPSVIVLDITMPHIDGLEILSQVKERFPDTKILVHTVHETLEKVQDCFARGAAGYAVKGDNYTTILTAVCSVGDGHTFLSPLVCRPLIEHYLTLTQQYPNSATSWDSLTPRERDIVRLTARGLRVREIAKRLSITPKTVDNCRYRIRQKLNLPTLSALISFALAHEQAQSPEH